MSLDAARESLTLLKNEEDALPLEKGTRLLVTGPGANSLNALNGAWTHTWQGVDTQFNTSGKATIFQALQEMNGEANTQWMPMTYKDSVAPVFSASQLARTDVIVLCLGEEPSTEKPGDIEDLSIGQPQIDLAKAAAKTGKKLILVLTEGRPRIINEIEPLVPGILMAYFPGDEGGTAISEALFGKINPSGKLPYTYHKTAGSVILDDYKYTETRDKNFGYNAFQPLYRFGHGLSYTSFAYSGLRISSDTLGLDDSLRVSVEVKNTGDRPGKEVVQLYVRDEYASITPSQRRLRKFQKIELKPGEQRRVSFTLGAQDHAFVGRENKWILEPGDYTLMIDTLSQKYFGNWEWVEKRNNLQ